LENKGLRQLKGEKKNRKPNCRKGESCRSVRTSFLKRRKKKNNRKKVEVLKNREPSHGKRVVNPGFQKMFLGVREQEGGKKKIGVFCQ